MKNHRSFKKKSVRKKWSSVPYDVALLMQKMDQLGLWSLQHASLSGLDSLDLLQCDVSGQDSETNLEALRDSTGQNAPAATKNKRSLSENPQTISEAWNRLDGFPFLHVGPFWPYVCLAIMFWSVQMKWFLRCLWPWTIEVQIRSYSSWCLVTDALPMGNHDLESAWLDVSTDTKAIKWFECSNTLWELSDPLKHPVVMSPQIPNTINVAFLWRYKNGDWSKILTGSTFWVFFVFCIALSGSHAGGFSYWSSCFASLWLCQDRCLTKPPFCLIEIMCFFLKSVFFS